MKLTRAGDGVGHRSGMIGDTRALLKRVTRTCVEVLSFTLSLPMFHITFPPSPSHPQTIMTSFMGLIRVFSDSNKCICALGALQPYDGWQQRANVLLIDNYIASKSTSNHIELHYGLNCSANLIGVFFGQRQI